MIVRWGEMLAMGKVNIDVELWLISYWYLEFSIYWLSFEGIFGIFKDVWQCGGMKIEFHKLLLQVVINCEQNLNESSWFSSIKKSMSEFHKKNFNRTQGRSSPTILLSNITKLFHFYFARIQLNLILNNQYLYKFKFLYN